MCLSTLASGVVWWQNAGNHWRFYKARHSSALLFTLFLSGFPALLYQIVWQRALFTLYGVNIESVTMIVAVFMLGLGMGSLAGGWLSTRKGIRLLLAFGLIEFSVGSFGAASLWIFHRIGSLTSGASTTATGLIAFALLLVPTMLMGSTLPLLVEHFVRRTGNVGESVGLLYSVNTLGSGVACLAAAFLLMRALGESGTVRVAVCFNLFVGVTALLLQWKNSTPALPKQEPESPRPQATVPFWIGMVLAAATGFIALAYEIVWYRLYSFASGGTAPCFAELLGFYLFGIAYGSFAVRDACRQKLGNDLRRTLGAGATVVLLGSIAAFLLGPALALWVAHFNYRLSYVFVFVAAALLGSAFPLLSHAAIDPVSNSGRRISFIYMSNIAGSTLGSFLVGFVIMDHYSTRATSLLLLGLGFSVAVILALLAGSRAPKGLLVAGGVACAALALTAGPLFSGIYERLLFKGGYDRSMSFSDVVENRSGVIGVLPSTKEFGYLTWIVFSGGVYDGQINTDLLQDSNKIYRAYAIWGMHPKPKNVLVIGLATGAWTQVLVNDPNVEQATVVEINPGFLPLIGKYAEVESLLRNPKVHIVIDDGRRWLVAHPESRFDFIMMNTTWNYRANASNLLSTEFMALMRAHLNPGGIAYYNTTWSGDVLATGASAFPYALRINSFLAVSDSPIALDKNLWRTTLCSYRIDGRPVFDLSQPDQRARLEDVLHLADTLDLPNSQLESRASLLGRLKNARMITDDNMG
ncbi:MAG: fused MFS/spermidine synthase, partial [Terracidiphilus sp.]